MMLHGDTKEILQPGLQLLCLVRPGLQLMEAAPYRLLELRPWHGVEARFLDRRITNTM